MFKLQSIIRAIASWGTAATLALAPAYAAPMGAPAYPDHVVPVQADCHAVGMRVAAQEGASDFKSTLETRGGQSVCVVVIVVPAKDGQRPRRKEVIVPAG